MGWLFCRDGLTFFAHGRVGLGARCPTPHNGNNNTQSIVWLREKKTHIHLVHPSHSNRFYIVELSDPHRKRWGSDCIGYEVSVGPGRSYMNQYCTCSASGSTTGRVYPSVHYNVSQLPKLGCTNHMIVVELEITINSDIKVSFIKTQPPALGTFNYADCCRCTSSLYLYT